MKINDDFISLLPPDMRDIYRPKNIWPFRKTELNKIMVQIEKNGELKVLSLEYARKKYLGHEKSWKIIDSARRGFDTPFNGWTIRSMWRR